MEIADAQREVRSVFVGGFPGQIVSGILWLLSAGLATWSSPRLGIGVLVVGGALIYPGALVLLRVMGRRASLDAGNPMGQLATQVAITIPANLPIVAGATLYRLNWFYPAMMVVVGAHYFPFVFLYGMRLFALLGALLVGGGVAIGLYFGGRFDSGAWFTGVLLLIFGIVGRSVALSEERGR